MEPVRGRRGRGLPARRSRPRARARPAEPSSGMRSVLGLERSASRRPDVRGPRPWRSGRPRRAPRGRRRCRAQARADLRPRRVRRWSPRRSPRARELDGAGDGRARSASGSASGAGTATATVPPFEPGPRNGLSAPASISTGTIVTASVGASAADGASVPPPRPLRSLGRGRARTARLSASCSREPGRRATLVRATAGREWPRARAATYVPAAAAPRTVSQPARRTVPPPVGPRRSCRPTGAIVIPRVAGEEMTIAIFAARCRARDPLRRASSSSRRGACSDARSRS